MPRSKRNERNRLLRAATGNTLMTAMNRIDPISATLARTLCALALSYAVVFAGWATDVQFTLSPRETWIGTPSILKIVVHDGEVISNPTLPLVHGLNLELQPGRSSMNSMNMINGTITRENTTTISVMVTPSVAGVFTIPPVSIVVDGQMYTSAAMALSSSISTTGDLLRVEVIGDSQEVWLGQPLGVTLRIFVKPFRSTEHKVTLGEADMWQFIDQKLCDFGPFTAAIRELAQRGQRPLGHEQLIDGLAYLTYDLRGEIMPAKSGTPSFDDVRIAWNYPVRLTATRGFFGGNELSVSATKPISAVPSPAHIEVKPLPVDGQPASFHGAVGSFTLSASAKPLRAAVGDPITLTLAITASTKASGLAQLHPPPLDSAQLLADFRIPSGPLAGTVTGNQKTFTQTLRATRPGITSIPSIAFSWFDPSTGTYCTTHTDPIAIDVVASDHISTDAILGKKDPADSVAAKRTANDGGLVASIHPTLSMVRDQAQTLGWGAAAGALLIPPALCAGVLLARRRAQRFVGDDGALREAGASAHARGRVTRGEFAPAIADYIADRLRLPNRSITRRDAANALQWAGASAEVRAKVDALLGAADRARFDASCGQNAATSQTASQRGETEQCLRVLETLDWHAARTARKEQGS